MMLSFSVTKRLTEVILEEELRSSKELETKITVGKKLIQSICNSVLYFILL